MYRHLNAERIAGTVDCLCRRVEERFPGSGLSRVSRELLEVARQRRIDRNAWRRFGLHGCRRRGGDRERNGGGNGKFYAELPG